MLCCWNSVLRMLWSVRYYDGVLNTFFLRTINAKDAFDKATLIISSTTLMAREEIVSREVGFEIGGSTKRWGDVGFTSAERGDEGFFNKAGEDETVRDGLESKMAGDDISLVVLLAAADAWEVTVGVSRDSLRCWTLTIVCRVDSNSSVGVIGLILPEYNGGRYSIPAVRWWGDIYDTSIEFDITQNINTLGYTSMWRSTQICITGERRHSTCSNWTRLNNWLKLRFHGNVLMKITTSMTKESQTLRISSTGISGNRFFASVIILSISFAEIRPSLCSLVSWRSLIFIFSTVMGGCFRVLTKLWLKMI